MAQATFVADALTARGFATELVPLETQGDQRLDVTLSSMGGQGVFVAEIQRALLEGRADVAVHSAKDLPSQTPEGLTLAAVPRRADARDVLVGRALAGLGPGATVATGSPRRRALLLERRPDLHIVELRGNMATRLGAVATAGIDAVVAAAAALERLGQSSLAAEYLDPTWFVPQIGQGALALECRADDDDTAAALAHLHDEAAGITLFAERAFLRELGTGCALPVGASARLDGTTVVVSGVIVAPDGARSVRAERSGSDPEVVGAGLAAFLRDDLGGGAFVP
jgi:hydroxymethylbilane synthase